MSGDDGKTWRKAAVSSAQGKYAAVFATPKDARAISLKTRVVTADGAVTEQTTIRAYPPR